MANMNDASRKANDLASQAADTAKEGSHRIMDKVSEWTDTAKDKLNNMSDTMQTGCDQMRTYVKQNPMLSVGIAVAVGSLLTLIFKRGD